MKQKQHHEGRVEVPAFKSNKVVLDHGVARWIKGRIYQVKGSCTYLVYCGMDYDICELYAKNLYCARLE